MSSKRKKKVSLKFPCTCGHLKQMHGWAGPSIGDEWCNGFNLDFTRPSSTPCDCMGYVPDNLKYLEQCLQKKRKIT